MVSTRSRSSGRRRAAQSPEPQAAPSSPDSVAPPDHAHEPEAGPMDATDLLRAIFEAHDADGNGVLSLSELAVAFAAAGVPRSYMEVRELLEDADTDHSGDLDFDEFLKAVREAGPASPWASLGTSDSQGHAEREAVVRAEASLSRVLAPLHTQAHKDALLMAEGDPTRYIALPGTDVAVPLATPGSRILGRTLSLLVLLAASVAAAALTAATAGTVAAAVHLYNRPSLDISLAVLAGLAEGGHMRWALLGGALLGPLAFASFPALRRGKTVAAWLAGNTVIVASTGRPLHPLLTMLRESVSGMCLPLDLGFALCVSPSGQRLVDYLLGTQVVADVTADVAA